MEDCKICIRSWMNHKSPVEDWNHSSKRSQMESFQSTSADMISLNSCHQNPTRHIFGNDWVDRPSGPHKSSPIHEIMMRDLTLTKPHHRQTENDYDENDYEENDYEEEVEDIIIIKDTTRNENDDDNDKDKAKQVEDDKGHIYSNLSHSTSSISIKTFTSIRAILNFEISQNFNPHQLGKDFTKDSRHSRHSKHSKEVERERDDDSFISYFDVPPPSPVLKLESQHEIKVKEFLESQREREQVQGREEQRREKVEIKSKTKNNFSNLKSLRESNVSTFIADKTVNEKIFKDKDDYIMKNEEGKEKEKGERDEFSISKKINLLKKIQFKDLFSFVN